MADSLRSLWTWWAPATPSIAHDHTRTRTNALKQAPDAAQATRDSGSAVSAAVPSDVSVSPPDASRPPHDMRPQDAPTHTAPQAAPPDVADAAGHTAVRHTDSRHHAPQDGDETAAPARAAKESAHVSAAHHTQTHKVVGHNQKRAPRAHSAHSRRRRDVLLSPASHEEWVPSVWAASPPYLLYDLCTSAAAAALAAACACAWFSAGSGITVAIGKSGVADGAALAAWLRASWLIAVAALRRSAAASALIGSAVGAAVFGVMRSLPRPSAIGLLQAEAALLETVEGDVRHHWTVFETHTHTHTHTHTQSRHHTHEGTDTAGTQHAHSAQPGSAPGRIRWHVHSLHLARRPATRAPVRVHEPLVLLPGHSAGAAHWESMLDAVSHVSDVYVLDLPGWGRSPMPSPLAAAAEGDGRTDDIIRMHATMLAGWMDANGLTRVALMGHSFGGFHAVHFARLFPERVAQLILVAPVGGSTVMPEGGYMWGLYFKYLPPQRIARNTGRLGYAVFRSLYLTFTVEDPRFPDYYYQLAAATAYTGKGDHLAARFVQFDWKGGLWWTSPMLTELMALQMPLGIIWGQRDEVLPPIFAPLLHRIRPNTDVYIIKDALHNPAHNNARAFCDAVVDCLLKYRGEPRTTMRGRCPGDLYQDGTADLLLQPDAKPTSGYNAPTSVASGASSVTAPSTAIAEAYSEPPSLLRRALLHRTEEESAADGPGSLLHVDSHASISSSVASWDSDNPSPSQASERSASGDDVDGILGTPDRPARRSDKLLFTPGSAAELHLLTLPSPTTQARLRRQGGRGSVDVTASAGIASEFGRGRGYCAACFRAVHNHKSYWRCACAAWSFNGFVDRARTRQHFLALLAFLDELYVHGTFNAQTSRTIVMYLRVRSPLPARAPDASADGAAASSAVATGVRPPSSTSLAQRTAQGWRAPAADTTSTTVEAATDDALAMWVNASTAASASASSSNGPLRIHFPPGGSSFPRGHVFLLD